MKQKLGGQIVAGRVTLSAVALAKETDFLTQREQRSQSGKEKRFFPRPGPGATGLDWIRLAWTGYDWPGLDTTGLDWIRPAWTGYDRNK